MRWRWLRPALLLLLAAGGGGCATSSGWHAGPTALNAQERSIAAKAPETNNPESFGRVWKGAVPKVGLLKWDDRSAAAAGTPTGMLQVIRDELGRLNQPAGLKGEDLSVIVTVYDFAGGGVFSDPAAAYEVVARNKRGDAVWAASDRIKADRALAVSLADTTELLIARQVVRKVAREFRR